MSYAKDRDAHSNNIIWEMIGFTGETLKRFTDPGENILAEITVFVLEQSGVHQGYLACDLKTQEVARLWSKRDSLKEQIDAIKEYRSLISSQTIDPWKCYDQFVKQVFIEQYCLLLIDGLYKAIFAQGYLRITP